MRLLPLPYTWWRVLGKHFILFLRGLNCKNFQLNIHVLFLRTTCSKRIIAHGKRTSESERKRESKGWEKREINFIFAYSNHACTINSNMYYIISIANWSKLSTGLAILVTLYGIVCAKYQLCVKFLAILDIINRHVVLYQQKNNNQNCEWINFLFIFRYFRLCVQIMRYVYCFSLR